MVLGVLGGMMRDEYRKELVVKVTCERHAKGSGRENSHVRR